MILSANDNIEKFSFIQIAYVFAVKTLEEMRLQHTTFYILINYLADDRLYLTPIFSLMNEAMRKVFYQSHDVEISSPNKKNSCNL